MSTEKMPSGLIPYGLHHKFARDAFLWIPNWETVGAVEHEEFVQDLIDLAIVDGKVRPIRIFNATGTKIDANGCWDSVAINRNPRFDVGTILLGDFFLEVDSNVKELWKVDDDKCTEHGISLHRGLCSEFTDAVNALCYDYEKSGITGSTVTI